MRAPRLVTVASSASRLVPYSTLFRSVLGFWFRGRRAGALAPGYYVSGLSAWIRRAHQFPGSWHWPDWVWLPGSARTLAGAGRLRGSQFVHAIASVSRWLAAPTVRKKE